MEQKIKRAYQGLMAITQKIRTLRAWADLARDERMNRSPNLPRVPDHSEEDLKAEIDYFRYLCFLVMEELSHASSQIRKRWEPRVTRLWKRYDPWIAGKAL